MHTRIKWLQHVCIIQYIFKKVWSFFNINFLHYTEGANVVFHCLIATITYFGCSGPLLHCLRSFKNSLFLSSQKTKYCTDCWWLTYLLVTCLVCCQLTFSMLSWFDNYSPGLYLDFYPVPYDHCPTVSSTLMTFLWVLGHCHFFVTYISITSYVICLFLCGD